MDEKVIGETKDKKPLNKKVVIGIVAAVVVLAIILIVVLMSKENDEGVATGEGNNSGPVANTNAEIVKEFELEGLKFSNISVIIEEDGSSILSIDVTNPTSSAIKMDSVDVIFKDKNGNEIVTLLGYFGGEVPAGETRVISAQTGIDLSNAVAREVKVNK